jgi:hypothetical protein
MDDFPVIFRCALPNLSALRRLPNRKQNDSTLGQHTLDDP